jgi:glycosyltransferase involved in cell wall biosynthesis
VIASRIGGIPELVREGETGWLFDPGNSVQLRERIVGAVRDPRAAHGLGRSARAFVENYGDAEHRYPELLELYERAISLRRRISFP